MNNARGSASLGARVWFDTEDIVVELRWRAPQHYIIYSASEKDTETVKTRYFFGEKFARRKKSVPVRYITVFYVTTRSSHILDLVLLSRQNCRLF